MPVIDATYDDTADAAYLYLSPPQNADPWESLEVRKTPPGVTMVLDFDTDYFLVGLEILGASNCLPQDVLDGYRQIGGPGHPVPSWVSSAVPAAWPLRMWLRLVAVIRRW